MYYEKIDTETKSPYFIDGNFKWYVESRLQTYITNKQADNLPSLDNMYAFVVINEKEGEEVSNYVIIDGYQNILHEHNYNKEGFDNTLAWINIIKITKHFEDGEKKRKYSK